MFYLFIYVYHHCILLTRDDASVFYLLGTMLVCFYTCGNLFCDTPIIILNSVLLILTLQNKLFELNIQTYMHTHTHKYYTSKHSIVSFLHHPLTRIVVYPHTHTVTYTHTHIHTHAHTVQHANTHTHTHTHTHLARIHM